MAIETRHSFCRFATRPAQWKLTSTQRSTGHRGTRSARGPAVRGYTCIKGRQLPDQIHHPDRLRAAFARTADGRLEEVSSADALDQMAAKLADIIERHGPNAVASYTGTGGYQNSAALAAAQAFHKGIESTSLYTSVTIDQPAKSMVPATIGWWEAGFNNFRDADVSMAIGYNPMVSSYAATGGLQGTNPYTEMRRAKKRGLKLIVIDPRQTELASFADIHIQVRPGEDPTLLAGMLNVILTEGLHDLEFCEQWVDGVDALLESVAPFNA